jgi:hypothetical protein
MGHEVIPLVITIRSGTRDNFSKPWFFPHHQVMTDRLNPGFFITFQHKHRGLDGYQLYRGKSELNFSLSLPAVPNTQEETRGYRQEALCLVG